MNPSDPSIPHTEEHAGRALNGWLMLFINLGILASALVVFILGAALAPLLIPVAILAGIGGFISLFGHFTIQPNEARVMILFGNYHGTVRESGFHWANPFYSRVRAKIPLTGPQAVPMRNAQTGGISMPYRALGCKISLRARNFVTEKLKVNDRRGNPIEIAAVIVWRVSDTARAAFDVDDFENYVQIQSESAIRHIASLYSYDRGEDDEPTLRDSSDEVAAALRDELHLRLEKAGIEVEEARLTHLAYAPEIAQAMLRRQQAEAVIAARTKIVHGAVSMVEMALRELSEKQVITLDEERKAAMVSNLLVVLCGETEASPVINTGTLYA